MPNIAKIIRVEGQGLAGPNVVSGSTATSLSGLLFGNGSAVSAAAAAQVRAVLGITEHASVAAANAALGGIGRVYFNTSTNKYETTTAAA